MTQDDGTVYAEDSEGISDQFSLSSRTPCRTVWTFAISKTRTVVLEGKIQERYGLAKDQVKKDVDDWYGKQSW